MIGGILGRNDPDVHERIVKFIELAANCTIYSSALDITDAANQLAAEGHPVDFDDLATVTPYLTHPSPTATRSTNRRSSSSWRPRSTPKPWSPSPPRAPSR